jgi:hypothetical protein
LPDAGTVSHEKAITKAEKEYEKYQKKSSTELSTVEQVYLENLKKVQKKIEKK